MRKQRKDRVPDKLEIKYNKYNFADFAGFYENGLYTPLGLRVAPKEEREQSILLFVKL